ncbi:MAG: DUF4157 domain-containing protein [Kofleriaceae bacterium]
MGSESSHRRARDELARDLARQHQIEIARANELLLQAERLATHDPYQRAVSELFVLVLRREQAAQREAARDAAEANAPRPGRETLISRDVTDETHGEHVASRPQALDGPTRWRMEQAFGVDFNGVSVIPDSPEATGATRALARDTKIHFRRGAYQPGTTAGDRLIAHELAHVVQQRGGSHMRAAPRPAIEREADRAASLVSAGRAAPIALRAAPGTAYAYSDDEDHTHHDDHADPDHGENANQPGHKVTRHWLEALGGSSGRPLPAALRKRLEVALAADLSGVRVHDGAVSDDAAKQINANAFTLGKDIHFARGKYAPGTPEGQELIAHEVAHTVQGHHVTDVSQATISQPGDAREAAAHQFASEFVRRQADAQVAPKARDPEAMAAAHRAAGHAPAKPVVSARGTAPSMPVAAPAPGVSLGSFSGAIVHRDGADGPAAPPSKAAKKKPAAPTAKEPDLDQGELAKNKKDANDPEQDKKDKEKFEKDNPNAQKDPDPIKPVVKAPAVQTPTPSEKKATETPPKKGDKAPKTDLKAPPKSGASSAKPKVEAPKKGKAESAVCQAADMDVGNFFKTATKDPKAQDISKRSQEMWAAAQGLGPAADGDDMIAALNPVTAVYNDGFGKSDLGQAVAGLDQSKSPYAEFNEKYRGIAMTMAGIRDVAFNLSNVLGKIGLVLTVVGFILSLFGVGAILVTIGRVISIINIILDAVAAVAGIIVACITAAQIKEETDPYKKAKLAKLLISDVNKAASNAVNFVLGKSKAVGKVVGKAVKQIGRAIAFVVRPIAKAISAVYARMSTFFAKLAKSKGAGRHVGKAFGAVERTAQGLGKKAMSNRQKVMADVDARDAKKASDTAAAKSKKAEAADTAAQGKQPGADGDLAKAKQAKIDADNAAKTKTDAADAKTKELEAKKTEAQTKKGELEGAKKSEADAKAEAKQTERARKEANTAKGKAEKAAKVKQEAATAAEARQKAADDALAASEAQTKASQKVEADASTALDNARAAEKTATEAAERANAAAERAKNAAGGDAATAKQASDDAAKAAAEAQRAADSVAIAQREAQQAKQAANGAATTEKALQDAKAKAAIDTKAAARAQEIAAQQAADAQAAAAKAEAAAQKAITDKATAEKIKQEADVAKLEADRAAAAKNAADNAAARKAEADVANAKAQADAQKAVEQKTAADTAASERATAEAKAVEAQKTADIQKQKAADAQKAADTQAAKSKADADLAAKRKTDADAQVAKDKAEVTRRDNELKQAEADRAAKVAKENADKSAADAATQKATQAQEAKRIADEKLKSDTATAETAATEAKAKKEAWGERQKDVTTAKAHKNAADEAADPAKKAANNADAAAKQADDAATEARKQQDNAETKKTEADANAKAAAEAKTLADKEAKEAAQKAADAEQHLKDAEAHKKETKITDPDGNGPMPQPKERVNDTMTGDQVGQGAGTYAVGQWQQEVATKNDPRDQWGTPGFLPFGFGGTGRLDLDPNKSPIRAPRMSELKASTARSVNVADAVNKIFAKKDDPAQQPATPGPTATPSPEAKPEVKPEAKQDPAATFAEIGPIPYWPELVAQYGFDLTAMGEARGQVQGYKAAQQAAVAMAKGDLKKRAAEIRAEAAARKAPIKQNTEGLDKDSKNLNESKAGNKEQIDNENKADQEKNQADGPANQGADAAEQAAAAEPPPAKGWWGKIKAAANWLLKNTLGRAMKFVTDALTNVVLFTIKHAMGVDVKELANYGMQTADEGTTKAGEGKADTAQAGEKNDKNEQEIAQEDMTLGQRIAAGEKNVKEAEAFEKSITDQEKALQAEIKACGDFVNQVTEAFAKCKADAEKAAAQPPSPDKDEPPAPANDNQSPPAPDKQAATNDPHAANLLNEAQTLCSSSVDTQVAELQALNAKGASILMAQAGSDPAEIAEAEKLAKRVENGPVKAAIDKLTGLKAKTANGAEDAIVAAAQEIDACHDAADAIADAFIAAEAELLSNAAAPPN